MRAAFNGLRYIVCTGKQWRFIPCDLTPSMVAYHQTQRSIRACVFEIVVEDLRSLPGGFAGREPKPTAMILDGRTIQSTPESQCKLPRLLARLRQIAYDLDFLWKGGAQNKKDALRFLRLNRV